MLVYAREESQLAWYVPSQLSGLTLRYQFTVHSASSLCKGNTYHSPWIVHESEGPVAGSVSQNWVCRNAPPG
jgi:hypothetical protein